MLITDYFSFLERIINTSPIITTYSLSLDQRSRHIGFIKGTLIFYDHSQLHFKEFVDTQYKLTKYKYGYHYQKKGRFIFRYDNFIHSPGNPIHHKHLPSSKKPIPLTSPPSLETVLQEIILLLPSSP